MKNQLLFAFIALLSLCTCKKADIPPAQDCEAVTYYIDIYDADWKYLKTDVSAHWDKVCGDDLARFKTYQKESLICGETKILRLVIGDSTIQYKQ